MTTDIEPIVKHFESFITFLKKGPCEDDDDFVTYNNVTITRNFTDGGPKEQPREGHKYLRVDFNKVTGDVVFRLKSGGCRLIKLSMKEPPKYLGEHKEAGAFLKDTPIEDILDDSSSDEEVIVRKKKKVTEGRAQAFVPLKKKSP